jgi:hypothetical protein
MARQMPLRAALPVVLLSIASAAPADAGSREFLRELRATMTAMRAESVADAARIEEAYGALADVAALADRRALTAAHDTGLIAPLPRHAALFNIEPRLRGAHPIAERDLGYQPLYVAAHPAALGCLLQVAARVRSAPLEVTSLVRHLHYQRILGQTNPNAVTDLPVHTFGLAFDISVLNVPLRTTAEIRDVLREMRDAGDLFFVAETRQLVFHVVPAPERLAFFSALFQGLSSLLPPPPGLGVERNLLAEAGVDQGWRQAEAAAPRGLLALLPSPEWWSIPLVVLGGVVAATVRQHR